jgi:predicted regulator of Ras-like GTPase activity (Roadblock/LC7/MglB family)
MLSFEETLRAIVDRIDGAVGAVIMGLDGISVARVDARPGVVDIDVAAAEYTALLRKSMRTMEDDASLGEMRELVVVSDRLAFLITLITREYFLLLVLESPGGLGRARFELRKAQLKLEEEFSV